MELYEVIAKKNFHNTVVGEVITKQRLRIPKHLAKQLEAMNMVEIISNPIKAVPQIPVLLKPLVNGQAGLAASLPVDQALQSQTVKPQRRGRKKKDGNSFA